MMDHTQAQTLTRTNHNGRQPKPAMTPAATSEVEPACYYAAYELVCRIDDDLTRQTGHYRNRAGELLHSLDQVVLAIIEDDLLTEPAVLVTA